jgi:multidrug resistance efflux pump
MSIDITTSQPAHKRRKRWPNESEWARQDAMGHAYNAQTLIASAQTEIDEAQADIDRACSLLDTDPAEARQLLLLATRKQAQATRKQAEAKVQLEELQRKLEAVGPGKEKEAAGQVS